MFTLYLFKVADKLRHVGFQIILEMERKLQCLVGLYLIYVNVDNYFVMQIDAFIHVFFLFYVHSHYKSSAGIQGLGQGGGQVGDVCTFPAQRVNKR
jgi:hypothetical protein